jgi:hypothetical protein
MAAVVPDLGDSLANKTQTSCVRTGARAAPVYGKPVAARRASVRESRFRPCTKLRFDPEPRWPQGEALAQRRGESTTAWNTGDAGLRNRSVDIK